MILCKVRQWEIRTFADEPSLLRNNQLAASVENGL